MLDLIEIFLMDTKLSLTIFILFYCQDIIEWFNWVLMDIT